MSDETRKVGKTGRRVYVARHVIATLCECFTLAEILYYYTHDGEQTLHGAVWAWLCDFCKRAQERAIFRRKLREIRDLPETPAQHE